MSETSNADGDASFAIAVCANGAEGQVKSAMSAGGWRLAFSRPGLVTAKHDSPSAALPSDVFIRTSMHSVGQVRGEAVGAFVDPLSKLIDAVPIDRFDDVHVFPRDRVPVGRFGFEPGPDEVTAAVVDALRERLGDHTKLDGATWNGVASPFAKVLDIAMVTPDQWMVGYHRATGPHAMWPGGVQPVSPKYPPISRAYYKAAEAVAWSGFELRPNDLAVEIGSAPGGACGFLLEHGLRVIGVDPAEMDPRIYKHPNYRHLRARGGDVPRREYAGAKWLLVDSNVRPEPTLSTVENVVRHRDVPIEGALVTLKIGAYDNAGVIDRCVDRVRGWELEGKRVDTVEVKQLARNKVEVCLAIGFEAG